MFNYNSKGENIPTSLGISKERTKELINLCSDIAKNAISKGRTNSNDILEQISKIPTNMEDSFLLGMFTNEIFHSFDSLKKSKDEE